MFKTLNECNVQLVQHMGTDLTPCQAARVSFDTTTNWKLLGWEDEEDADTRTSVATPIYDLHDKDKKLIHYLASHAHMSPFEHQAATFLVEAPLFVAREWMRHRSFSFNEVSRRYTSENIEFWMPDELRKQSESNRQASSDARIDEEEVHLRNYKWRLEEALEDYNDMLSAGVCREQARAILPQAMLTKFYVTGNLRAWAHWWSLRSSDDAQKEIRHYADVLGNELKKLWPNSWEALTK